MAAAPATMGLLPMCGKLVYSNAGPSAAERAISGAKIRHPIQTDQPFPIVEEPFFCRADDR